MFWWIHDLEKKTTRIYAHVFFWLTIVGAIVFVVSRLQLNDAFAAAESYFEHQKSGWGILEAFLRGVVWDFDYISRVDDTMKALIDKVRFWSLCTKVSFWGTLICGFLTYLAWQLSKAQQWEVEPEDSVGE